MRKWITDIRKSISDKRKARANPPDFYVVYASKFMDELDPRKKLMDIDYAIIDTEASGLDVQNDEIVSIGGVILSDRSIDLSNSISIYVSNRQVRDRKALELHGVLPDQPFGVDELQALISLLDFVGNKIIVGHYLGFDLKMINNLLAKYGAPPLKNKVLDTSELTKRVDFPLRNYQFVVEKQYTLDALCARYGVIPKERHTAAGDAYITAILFQKILVELGKKGVLTVKDLKI